MRLFLPVERATLLIPSGSADDADRKHLFILLCNPVSTEVLVLLGSVSSIKSGRYHDPTCIIEPSETAHEFIKRRSFIDYSKLRIEPAAKIIKGVERGDFVPYGTIEAELLQRILQGVMTSPRTAPKFKKFVQQHSLLP